MTYRVRNIVVAVVLAALAGAMTIVYVVNYKRHVQNAEKKVSVLVAARDIPAGTTGSEVVEQHMLKTVAVPKGTLPAGWVSDADQLRNQVATDEIYTGEQVTTRHFAPPSEQGIRAHLRATERGFQLAGDANQLLAGTLREGDHVDVVGAWKIGDGDGNRVSRVILRNLYVLRAPEDTAEVAKLGGPTQGGTSAQLRVTDTQSQKLKWINEFGEGLKWHLELRPPVKSADSRNTYQNSRTMLFDGPGKRP